MTQKLAVDGGTPVRQSPLSPWPRYSEDEIALVSDVLRSGKVNQWTGDKVTSFQRAYADYIGVDFAIALANGSVAIELTLRAYGIGPGDEVIVTPRSFLASCSSVDLVGAKAVFADIDFESQNLTAETISACITPRTKAVIPVHLNGLPCDMPEIMKLAKEKDIIVIEDCAQAHGATIDGKPVGSFGHAATFSFCQDKIISTGGEGGLAVFKDRTIWEKAWSFKDHGKSWDAVFNRQHPIGYRWVHESIGTNWRMTEMQAALGLAQLSKLNDWSTKRNEIASRIGGSLNALPGLTVQNVPDEVRHAYYRLALRVVPEELKPDWDRDRLMAAINAEGIPCMVGSCPTLFKELAYEGQNSLIVTPNAEALGKVSLVLLCHPTLDTQYAMDVIAAFKKVIDAAKK